MIAEQARRTISSQQARPPLPGRSSGMRALWRLAIWGSSAAAALTLAVVASYSDTGSRRIIAAMAATGGKDTAQKPAAEAASRSPEAEAETRRLAEALSTLTADRDRLAARVDILERNLEDITGSINRQAASLIANPAPTATAAPAAATPPSPPSIIAALPSEPVPPEQGTQAAAAVDAPEAAKPELGVDVGGAINAEGLRALWNSAKGSHAALFEGLHPVVAVRENSRTKNRDLRLIVGPIENAEAAARLCATLTAARRYCQPAAFEGKRLVQSDAVPERKPAAPKTKPTVQSPWPFR